MASLSAAFASPLSERNTNHTDNQDDDTAGQLHRSGQSRQARRLQLRNAGFRGGALPTRKATPNSPASTAWSTTSELDGWSSNENVPPFGAPINTPSKGKRTSSSGLRDMSNDTVIRPKNARPRESISSAKMSDSDSPSEQPSSYQAQPKGTIRPRSVKTKAKVSQCRRSVSAETSKYIEHLESELGTALSQLSKINSPTVTRQQSSKLRNLDAETRQLQKEVEEWEAKYEERVQEEVDRHYAIETSLRGRIRGLEQDVDDARFRIQELEAQITTTAQNMEAVEAANVNLERRVEIMSELLAASPSKIDLHAQTPGRTKKHIRPKSMLPRFPTASSLLGSPERHPQTQPTSPLLTFTNYSPSVPSSPAQSVCRLETASQHSDFMSEAESVFSEVSPTGDSMTSAEIFDVQPSFNPWGLPPPQASKSKPTRRMRRFGAGSVGPKPLILPWTSACDQFPPTSAPPLERSETTPAFFPEHLGSSHGSHSPLLGRRRASTMANGETLAVVLASPFSETSPQHGGDVTLMDLHTSSSTTNSRPVTRDLSSFGSIGGRNLMDELTAVCTSESGINSEQTADSQMSFDRPHSESDASVDRSILDEGTTLVAKVSELGAASQVAMDGGPRHRSIRPRHVSLPIGHSASIFERMRFLFGDIWRSPLELALHLIHTVQGRVWIPRTLLNVQWWLVGALLGPMARRRMLSQPDLCERGEVESLLLEDSGQHEDRQTDRMAYGTLYEPPTSSTKRASSRESGRVKKRIGYRGRCPHHRAKHSPLLWIKFSITLAFAIGAAFKDGPGSLLRARICPCQQPRAVSECQLDEEPVDSLI